MNRELAIVGLGNMGRAIARAALEQGYSIYGYDIQMESFATLRNYPNFYEKKSFSELILEGKKPLLVAVKPGDVRSVVEKVPDDRLVISIAAGVNLAFLQKKRNSRGANIRVMPNLCILAKKGATVICPDEKATDQEVEFTQNLFSALGICEVIKDETLFDAITALSGSGPAYVFLFLQALEDSSVREGLSRNLAQKLAVETVKGALALWEQEKKNWSELIAQISSPGGTTIEALAKLKEKGFESALYEAIRSAAEKARFLGQKYS